MFASLRSKVRGSRCLWLPRVADAWELRLSEASLPGATFLLPLVGRLIGWGAATDEFQGLLNGSTTRIIENWVAVKPHRLKS
ncbi:MAG: hypothetical protein JWP08_1478 [Bryobacterales bacterium]|nr:hypothetical protein [Bryobacterales bacterium]